MTTYVRVVRAVDTEIYDVSEYVGRLGIFGGPAKENPEMSRVRFSDGDVMDFWPEEIEEFVPCSK